jgi:hypothetical protein
MLFTSRLHTVVALSLFIAAIGVVGQREQEIAAGPKPGWPELVEELIMLGLLALTFLLYLIISILGLVVALRKRERFWMIAIVSLAAGITALYLELLLPSGFLISMVRPYLPQSAFRTLLLLFIPMLLGCAFLTLYGFRTVRDLRSLLYIGLYSESGE